MAINLSKTNKVVVTCPTFLPTVPMKHNILGNFKLEFTTPAIHHIYITDQHHNPGDEQDLLNIVLGLLPNEPFLSEEETDADCHLYERLCIGSSYFTWIDETSLDKIKDLLKDANCLTLHVFPSRQIYAHTIFRALVLPQEIEGEKWVAFYDKHIKLCL